MKKDIHPTDYRSVVFQDLNDNSSFLTRSTAKSEGTIKWEDGNEYPLVKVHISSSSHPFYTGQEKLMDIEGRVDKFEARKKAAEKARDARTSAAKKQIETKEKKEAEAAAKAKAAVSGATAADK